MLHASEGNTKNFVVRRNATLEVVQTNCIWPATTSHDQIICFLKKKKKKGIKTSSIILIHQKNIIYLLIAKHYPYRKILLSAPTKLTKSHNNFRNILPTILLAPPFPRIPTRFNQRNHIHLLSPMVIPFQHVRSSPCLGRCTFSSAKMSSLVSE